MYYVIDKSSLWDRICEEVSHAADQAYGESGDSLYDSVMLTSKDKNLIERYIDDAISALVRREFDICKYSPLIEDYQPVAQRLLFHVPDFDTTMTETAIEQIDRYVSLYSCAALFQQRRVSLVQEYTSMAQAAMDKAVEILKSRKAPNDLW